VLSRIPLLRLFWPPCPKMSAAAADALTRAMAVLWPAPAKLRWGRAGEVAPAGWEIRAAYVAIPSRPVLLPTRRLPAAAMLKSKAGAGIALHRRLPRLVAASGLATGVVQGACRRRLFVEVRDHAVPPADGLAELLGDLFGRDVHLGLTLREDRVNRKSVVAVLDGRGRFLAFCKVASGPLTRALASNEEATLLELATCSLPGIHVPRLLHRGEICGSLVLVVSALPVSPIGRRPPPRRLSEAMLSLASVRGLRSSPLAKGAWWASVTQRLASLGPGRLTDCLRTSVGRLHDAAGDQPVTFGRWHGDWTCWNMAWQKTSCLLWDFERSTPWVPVGLDAVHLALDRAGEWHRYGRVDAVVERAPAAKRAVQQLGAQVASPSLVLSAYLVEIALRALGDTTLAPSPGAEQRAAARVEAVRCVLRGRP
jgi:hypothetical protein